jgi:hypothetical protein
MRCSIEPNAVTLNRRHNSERTSKRAGHSRPQPITETGAKTQAGRLRSAAGIRPPSTLSSDAPEQASGRLRRARHVATERERKQRPEQRVEAGGEDGDADLVLRGQNIRPPRSRNDQAVRPEQKAERHVGKRRRNRDPETGKRTGVDVNKLCRRRRNRKSLNSLCQASPA